MINKPAATRPDASDNSMTEATSMLDVAMLGLTANIGKLVTLLVSVGVNCFGVLVLLLWTIICCIHQKVTISITRS